MNKSKQIYEDYWKITLEYTDFNNNTKFLKILKTIVEFIDNNHKKEYSKEDYQQLQQKIQAFTKKNITSVRKSINQCIKLGFVFPFLKSYPLETIDFLNARTNRLRRSILSKIIYLYSSFNRSVTKDSQQREINFLIKTLENKGHLSKEDVIALMTIKDLSKYKKEYATSEEIETLKKDIKKTKFVSRKYNQVNYLYNILNKLDDLKIVQKNLYFKEDADRIYGSYNKDSNKRDNYLQRIYKNQLEEETFEKRGVVKCMVEDLPYPYLIASHILPFSVSNDKEAYDSKNGLLLSRNIDVLFDRGDISFEDSGKILVSNNLSKELRKHLEKYFILSSYLTKERLKYLEFHRINIFEK